jgi:photosystem II stability/assembly factor-like uncharacterized protein
MLKIKSVFLSILCLTLISETQAQVTEKSSDPRYDAYQFRNVGPFRGGRVTAIEGVPSIANTFYMGATGGGVWKTTDYGITWNNVSDGYFPTPSIGAISVALTNPDIVYVGTGSDGMRSNVITGKGMFKSTNGGKKWEFIGLKETGHIGAVEVHPTNPDIVYVAAIGQAFGTNEERGIFRTKDGGKNWDKILYHSDSIGFSDLEFAPDDPNTIYAGSWRGERKPWTIISGSKEGGVFKSNDGGDNWVHLKNGLPTNYIGKIDFAVSADDPDRVYANIEASDDQGGLYRSNDRGENWEFVSDNSNLTNRPFYYTNIDANPQNADVVFNSALRFQRSDNGGKTWKGMRTPHGDNHAVWINPNDTSIWVQANDGGANVTLNYGKSWSTQTNQPTSELYQVEVDDQQPYWLYAGQQDNSTVAVPSKPTGSASAPLFGIGGCETGPAVPKPGDHNIVYSNCKGRFGTYDKRTGQEQQYYVGATNIYGHNPKNLKFRFQRVAPIHVSSHNPDVVYHTSQYVHRTIDNGQTWEIISPDLTAFESTKQMTSGSPITRDVTGEEYYSTLYAIQESKLKEGLIWVGANDGPVHVTKDGGKSWDDVTPDMPKGGRVDGVEPSPHHEAKAYATILRYQLGDFKPYIYKTVDYGQNWELITAGIPDDFPVRVVREDPGREGVLYAGTEFGLFISLNDGESWKPFQQNLPVTPVTDIKVHQNDLILSTMGRGFWILENVTALHSMPEASNSDVHLFKPESIERFRYSSFGRGSDGPQFGNPGVTFDYYLNDDKADVQLEILNADGNVIKSFSSAKNEAFEDAEIDMSTGFLSTPPPSSGLKTKEGLNRFSWNMRHYGGWDKDAKRAYRGNGPMVAPGDFSVRLTSGDKVITEEFSIKPDPRNVLASVEDMQAQEKMALDIRAFSDEVNQFMELVAEERKAMDNSLDQERVSNRVQRKKEALDKVYYQVVTSPGTYMKPMLRDQTRYLNSMLGRADQRPGKDAYDRLEELKATLEAIKAEHAAIK